jgi:hypothetical protein
MLLLALAGAAQAQPKDPAELLPADTLAYLELRDPAQVSRELTALIKGSDLEDMPATMARFRQKMPAGAPMWALQDVGIFGIFLSPEVLAEGARLQGAAVAMTGVTKDREPEVVGIVLAGDSHGPTFVLRAFLTMDDFRTVADVNGVKLYRGLRRDFMAVKPVVGQPPPPPALREYGPVCAMLPGAVIVGSTTESVKQVVSRLQGRDKGATLAQDPTFQKTSRLRERPGLFGYANLARLGGILDDMLKNERASRAAHTGLILSTLVGNRALQTAAASLTLRNGELDLLAEVTVDPKVQSPLLDLLPDQKVDLQVLHAAPADSLFAATIALPDGEKRWQKLLELADAIAKQLGGDAPPPSKQVEAVEGMLGLRFGKDVFGRIRGATVALAPPAKSARDQDPAVIIILETVDADAAKALEDVIPKLVGLASRGEPPSPTTERIEGQRIRSVPGDGLPGRTALHYGQHGKLLVLGQDRRIVARGLAGATKKGGLLGEAKVAVTLRDVGEPIVVAVYPVGQSLIQWFAYRKSGMPAPPAPPPGAAPAPPIRKGEGQAGTAPALVRAGGVVKEPAASDVPEPGLLAQRRLGNGGDSPEEKLMQDLIKAFDPVPPLVITLSRKPEMLVLHIRQVGLRAAAPRIINALIEGSLESLMQQRAGRFGAVGTPVPVPAPPPPKPPPALPRRNQ